MSNINENDLFDNDMVRAAEKALSEKDKERYRALGEELFSTVDFERSQILNIPEPMEEAVAYIQEQLKSGLHISMLSDDEKVIMSDVYGPAWYEKWGYVKEDLDEMVTLKAI